MAGPPASSYDPFMIEPSFTIPSAVTGHAERDVYTVSQLNAEVRETLELAFPRSVWVEGELSNVARPSSGHIYFTLKDHQAQVRCAMFRGRNSALSFVPTNGMQVLARARVGLYDGRGEYQLVVEFLEESGDGALRRAFEQLKQKLDAEGLFDPARKRPLPALPRAIGVITSPTGAAIRDILSVLRRRFPAMPLIIYPVPVQGDGAAAQIAAAISVANARKDSDVLLVARGGGSLEDLWAFNEEVVARAIAGSELPIITGIGHEIDFTIADFCADVRAPTPSAAAELLTPDQNEWRQRVLRIAQRLELRQRELLSRWQRQLAWLTKRLDQQHPRQRLLQRMQRIDELEQRLYRAQRAHLRALQQRIVTATARLHRHAPDQQLARLAERRRYLYQRLRRSMAQRLERERQQLAAVGRALDTVSPLATLSRGYSVLTRSADGTVVTVADQLQAGERVNARLHRGRVECTVIQTFPPSEPTADS